MSHDSHLITLVYSLTLRSTEFNYLRGNAVGFNWIRGSIALTLIYSTRDCGRDEGYIRDVGRKFAFNTVNIFKLETCRRHNVYICEEIEIIAIIDANYIFDISFDKISQNLIVRRETEESL